MKADSATQGSPGLASKVPAGEFPARKGRSRAVAGAILAALVALAPARPAPAEEAARQAGQGSVGAPDLSMDEAVAAALERSATVVDARAAVESARLELGLSAPWRSSSLSARAAVGSASGQQGQQAVSPDLSWSLQAKAPLIEGLSLDASLSTASIQAGATLRPFTTPDTRTSTALEKALIQATEAERQASIQARAAYRAAWLSTLELAVKEAALQSASSRAEAAALNAAAGAATESQVIDADSARNEAEGALVDSADLEATALSELSRLVGRPVSKAELAEPDPGADRVPITKEAFLSAKASLSLLDLDLAAAKKAAKPAMPDLAVGASVAQALGSASGQATWSVTASVTIDPDSFLRGKDRSTALALAASLRRSEESRLDAAAEYDNLAARIASKRAALVATAKTLATAKAAFEKASYLAEAGTVSGSSLFDSQATLLSASFRVAKARAELGAALDQLDGTLGGAGSRLK